MQNLVETWPTGQGHKVQVFYDHDAINPMEDGDYMMPCATFSLGGDYKVYDGFKGVKELILELPLRWFGPKNAVKVAAACGVDDDGIKELSTLKLSSDRQEFLADYCGDEPRHWTDAQAYFDALTWLCKQHKMPSYHHVQHGSSQGESVQVFAMATWPWMRDMGVSPKQCLPQAEAATTADYMLGESYRFELLNAEGETVDSCGTYYGDAGLQEIKNLYPQN